MATDEALEREVARWDRLGWPRPSVLVVAGSGLGVDLGTETVASAPLADWLPFAVHPVEGHDHRLELLLTAAGRPVLYQRGRLHTYQGYDADQTVFTVRLGARLGVRCLIMTNAAGGLHAAQRPGSLMLIRDQINLTGLNPLRGNPPAEWGPRFPDMAQAYDPDLLRLTRGKATELGLELAEGVYAGVAGPSYETPAEVRMLQVMGADLVGMSTVLEVIAARHMGIRCLVLSLISNLASGVSAEALDHAEVLAAGRAAADDVRRLLTALLAEPELVPTIAVDDRPGQQPQA